MDLHTDFLSMTKNDAESVMTIVEEIVEDIISKLDKKEKEWVRSWIDQIIISYTV